MQSDAWAINCFLIEEDIEGFITLGAPADEYESEAAQIAQAFSQLDASQRTREMATRVITDIWMKNFNLPEEEMQLRLPGVTRVVTAIFQP